MDKALKIGDLIWIRKPLGEIYKIFDIKEYWIPKEGHSEPLTIQPKDLENYNFSRIYHYNHYSNSAGKILNVNDPTHCGERFVIPFDKEKVIEKHQKSIDKIKANENLTEKDLAQIEKLKANIENVKNNL